VHDIIKKQKKSGGSNAAATGSGSKRHASEATKVHRIVKVNTNEKSQLDSTTKSQSQSQSQPHNLPVHPQHFAEERSAFEEESKEV